MWNLKIKYKGYEKSREVETVAVYGLWCQINYEILKTNTITYNYYMV